MKTAKRYLAIGLAVLGIAGLIRLDFYVWKCAHPGAPTWTYFFHGR